MEIVPQYEESMVSAGLTDSTKMTFSTDVSHLFALLSKNLYSDSKLAAVREIITNAWDAHIDAGITDTPIKIRVEEGSFVIQDFGSGISPEKFIELYGVVGGSSKRSDNRQTGGMGIGKMAPLAAVSHFSVRSHYNGTATTYHIAGPTEESGGVPTITKVVELPTQLTGLEVIFPVDIYPFKKHIKKVVLTGAIKAVYVEGDVQKVLDTIEDTDFVYSRSSPFSVDAVLLRYGNISYRVPTFNLRDNVPSAPEILSLLSKYNWNIVIKLEPGIAVVTPNREDLIFTDSLYEYLEERIQAACKDIIRTTRKALKFDTLKVHQCSYAHKPWESTDKLITSFRCILDATTEEFFSYNTCHEKFYCAFNGDYFIGNDLRDDVVANYNKHLTPAFRNIHKRNVVEKKHIRFIRALHKTGISPKNVYGDNIHRSLTHPHTGRSFIYDLANNKKVFIHYGTNVPSRARSSDTLYIRLPKKIDAALLKTRLECLFGKEVSIEIQEKEKVVKRAPKVKAVTQTKYVCASALISPTFQGRDPENILLRSDETVEEPKIVISARAVNYRLREFLKHIGEDVIKKEGIVLVSNKTAGALFRRKTPPVVFHKFFENYVEDFLKKDEVTEFLKICNTKYEQYEVSAVMYDLCDKVLGIALKISQKDLSFLSWVCSQCHYIFVGSFPHPTPAKDIPENIKFLHEFTDSNIISELKKFNLYDAVITELRKQLND